MAASVAAPKQTAAAAAGVTKDAEPMRKRVEELRAQARALMHDLPAILKSQDGSVSSFCRSVIPVLTHESTTAIVEHLRTSKRIAHETNAPDGDSKAGPLLDLRQYATWGAAHQSIGEVFMKCVSQAHANSDQAEEGARAMPVLIGTCQPQASQRSVNACEGLNGWRDFGERNNVIGDASSSSTRSLRPLIS